MNDLDRREQRYDQSLSPAARTRGRRHHMVWIAAAVVVAAALIGWIGYRSLSGPSSAKPATPPMSVASATAESGNIMISISALGTITPLVTVTVKTQIAGRL